jgi:hypothetical protein
MLCVLLPKLKSLSSCRARSLRVEARKAGKYARVLFPFPAKTYDLLLKT